MIVEIYQIAGVSLLAFASGAINAAVGGGGMVTIPGLFATFPLQIPAFLLATDKVSSIFGHISAMRHYALRMQLPWKLIGLAASAAFLGALIGAHTVYSFPREWVRPLVIAMMAVMFVYTLVRRDFGSSDAGQPVTKARQAAGIGIGFMIGFYDGFFGPGTGSFLVFLFARVFRFDFLKATACAKVANLAADSGAVVYFLPAGAVVWKLAMPMAVSAYLGGLVGARLVMMGGNAWIRRAFLALSAILLIKLTSDYLV
ncbi:MAG: TSUP family transporter [Ancalomicrobiaceae bacterium]|nr:TSUP family transporter [Ancalomicrobiaceae bacterium]